jgi:hypothetical protein
MNEPVPARPGASVAGFDRGAAGVTPPSRAGRQGVFLTDVIVELGFASKQRIDEAEAAARSSGKTVEQILLDSGAIDEKQLSLAIAERNGLDHVDLEKFDVDLGAAESIPRSMATRCGAVPVAHAADGALIVAVQDPFDSLSARRIETTTGSEVRMVIAATSGIRQVIERLPKESSQSSSGDEDVPRMKSQRELAVDQQHESRELEEPTLPEQAEPAMAEPQMPAPEPPEPEPVSDGSDSDAIAAAAAAAAAQAGAADPEETAKPTSPAVEEFEGAGPQRIPLLDPPAPEPLEEGGPDGEGDAKRERELIETKGKVAELERRLEEVMSAAQEAINDKVTALRRVLDENRK